MLLMGTRARNESDSHSELFEERKETDHEFGGWSGGKR